jgi:hypothetical protein
VYPSSKSHPTSLAGYQGKIVSLADFRGVKNVVLVFNRTEAVAEKVVEAVNAGRQGVLDL